MAWKTKLYSNRLNFKAIKSKGSVCFDSFVAS